MSQIVPAWTVGQLGRSLASISGLQLPQQQQQITEATAVENKRKLFVPFTRLSNKLSSPIDMTKAFGSLTNKLHLATLALAEMILATGILVSFAAGAFCNGFAYFTATVSIFSGAFRFCLAHFATALQLSFSWHSVSSLTIGFGLHLSLMCLFFAVASFEVAAVAGTLNTTSAASWSLQSREEAFSSSFSASNAAALDNKTNDVSSKTVTLISMVLCILMTLLQFVGSVFHYRLHRRSLNLTSSTYVEEPVVSTTSAAT